MNEARVNETVAAVDVAIIGGGPAGSTAAIVLKRADPSLRVVVLERATFPRHHVGESTLPEANLVLARLGVLDAVKAAGFGRKGGITYLWNPEAGLFSESFSRDRLRRLEPSLGETPDWSFQVDRSRYDALLLDHARACGAEVWQPATVRQVWRAPGVGSNGGAPRVTGLQVQRGTGSATRDVRLRCGHVLDCSGHARVLGRALALPWEDLKLGDLALFRYYRGTTWDASVLSSPALSRIFFAASPAGWVWYIPLSPDTASVGLVTRKGAVAQRDLAALFDAELATVPAMAAMLAGATRTAAPGDLRTSPPDPYRVANWSYRHERTAGPGWYLAGDAAAFVDPILSSGVHVAHRSGLAAAQAVLTELANSQDAADPSAVPADEVRAAYDTYYRELVDGFVDMARFWYSHRDAGAADWQREAGRIAASRGDQASGSDVAAFLHLAAGRLSDVRLHGLATGFGDGGLRDAVARVAGVTLAEPPPRDEGELGAQRRPLLLQPGALRTGSQLTSLVTADRWHRLPELWHGDTVIRPPVALDDQRSPLVGTTWRLLDHLLSACDGQRSAADVLRSAPGPRDLAGRIASLLHGRGVLALAPDRATAPPVVATNQALRRDQPLTPSWRSVRCSVRPSLLAPETGLAQVVVTPTWSAAAAARTTLPLSATPSLAVFALPPERPDAAAAQARTVQALLDAFAQAAPPTLEQAVRSGVAAGVGGGASERAVRDLANVVASQWLRMGWLVT